jgi:hypothetical protein
VHLVVNAVDAIDEQGSLTLSVAPALLTLRQRDRLRAVLVGVPRRG